MTYLTLKKIKGVKYILKDKSGVMIGYSNQTELRKGYKKLKKANNFGSVYYWTNKDWLFRDGYCKLNEDEI